MRKNKNNLAYLLHIRDSLDKITLYAIAHTYEAFTQSDWDQAAVLRYLEVIGEAANKLEDTFRQLHPEIPWREVIDLRNVIIHDYINVDTKIIWRIITSDVPTLKEQIYAFLDELDSKD